MAQDSTTDAVADFYFGPPPGGFRWIEAPKKPQGGRFRGSHLYAELPEDWEVKNRLGDLEVADLFVRFGQLTPTKAGVLAFANDYGFLGVGRDIEFNGALVSAEPLERWESEIRAVRSATELAGAVAHNDIKSLKECLSLGEVDGTLRFHREDEYGTHQWHIKPIQSISKFVRKNDWKRAATIILHEMINKRLRRQSGVGVVFDNRRSDLTLRIHVDCLLAGIWMQLANSIALGRFAKCEACERLMVLAPGATRSDRKTCSDACRMALYRKRKKASKENSK